jgi:hypothetical protein
MSASAALAADATSVYVGGDLLNAASPYWKNGGGGSASDWNVFFDTGTSVPTLRMNGASVTTVSGVGALLQINGDIQIELLGSNSLSASVTSYAYPAGILVDGDLTVTDATADHSGSLSIEIRHSYPSSYAYSDGIYVAGSGKFTMESGTVRITLDDTNIAYGVYASNGLYIHGGAIVVESTAPIAYAVPVDYFTMTGGSIEVTINATNSVSRALRFNEALITGGYGKFVSTGNGYAMRWTPTTTKMFRVIGGQMIFSSENDALFFVTDETLIPYASGGIMASPSGSGSGKFRWSDSMGVLASNNLQTSSYHYVELLGGGATIPETGDASRPWLWVGVGLAGLLIAGGLLIWVLKRR